MVPITKYDIPLSKNHPSVTNVFLQDKVNLYNRLEGGSFSHLVLCGFGWLDNLKPIKFLLLDSQEEIDGPNVSVLRNWLVLAESSCCKTLTTSAPYR